MDQTEYKLEEPGAGEFSDGDDERPSSANSTREKTSSAGDSDDDSEDDAPTYSPEQLTSLLPPVSATMLLASIVIVNVRSDNVDELLTESLSSYAVSQYLPASSNSSSDSDTDDDSFWFALLNAGVIIAGIALLTFGIVLCYKFRCYKFLYGFFTFTIFVALGFETGQILYAFFEKFQIAADWVSLCFVLYNFAIVGAVGILYGKIVPRMLAQGYLITISICICYLLRYFPEWTGWILLVLLALWDLFAVLAPCGPLKALVKMASERQDPIPGLLYTANASADTEIRVARTTDDGDESSDSDDHDDHSNSNSNSNSNSGATDTHDVRVNINVDDAPRQKATTTAVAESDGFGDKNSFEDQTNAAEGCGSTAVRPDAKEMDNDDLQEREHDQDEEDQDHAHETNDEFPQSGRDADSQSQPEQAEDEARAAEQLVRDAELAQRLHDEELSERAAAAMMAAERDEVAASSAGGSGGGGGGGGEDADADAAAAAALAAADEEDDEEEDRSVKLGLGDFIFYSLLVGKAALAGWVPFAACFVVILCGLMATMILLALLKKPLPALPFSMLFGVTCFFWAQYTLAPQAAFQALSGIYV